MPEKEFIEHAMNLQASEMPSSLKVELEIRLRRRFGLKRHKSIFYNPTVRQWLTDLTGTYHPEDILSAFNQATGLKPSLFIEANIGDTIINRLFLIDLVEILEEATGRQLLKDDSLDYLGDSFSYLEMADFFTRDNGTA